MGAGLAGRPPCLPYSQVLMGAGLAGRPPCLNVVPRFLSLSIGIPVTHIFGDLDSLV